MTSRRARLLLFLLLGGQLVLLTVEARDRENPERSLLERWLTRAVAPLGNAVAVVAQAGRSAAAGFATERRLREENRRLAAELLDLRRDQLRLGRLEAEVVALSRGVAFADARGSAIEVARVVYLDPDSWQRTMLVRAGPGARRNQPVATDDGLVGRVLEVTGAYAKVQLVTDRAAAAAGELVRARRQGIVHGSSASELLLDLVPRQVDVEIGDRVVSAGVDGVYPPGIPIGVVIAVEPGSEIFHRIRLRPAVDFGALSWVYLLEGEAAPAPPDARGGANAPR